MRIKFLAALMLLGGCVPTSFYTQPIPLQVQADQLNMAAAQSERLMIVRNVMRARDRTSMVFTRLTSFTGSMQRTLSATASLTTHEGGDGATLTPGVTVGGQASPSFNMAILNDQKFHRAISTSVDLGLYRALLDSGWHSELLHTLFIERVDEGGHVYTNDPAHSLESGDTRCVQPGQTAAPHDAGTAPAAADAPQVSQFDNFQCWLRSHRGADGAVLPLQICSEAKPQALSPPLATTGFSDMQGAAAIAAQNLELGDDNRVVRPGQARWFVFASDCDHTEGGVQVRVTVRSIEGVIFYLGELVRAEQRDGHLRTIDIHGDADTLFQVQRASDGHPSGLVFQHEDGQTYYVAYPQALGASGPHDRTHQVITLLLQLIGVLQERTDVPATQTVRVLP